MKVLGRLMRDPSKANLVDIVHVLELLFDPEKLLMQLRSNDNHFKGFSQMDTVTDKFVESIIFGQQPIERGTPDPTYKVKGGTEPPRKSPHLSKKKDEGGRRKPPHGSKKNDEDGRGKLMAKWH